MQFIFVTFTVIEGDAEDPGTESNITPPVEKALESKAAVDYQERIATDAAVTSTTTMQKGVRNFAEKGKEDPRFAALAEIVSRNHGLWCLEAEQYLLSHWEDIE